MQEKIHPFSSVCDVQKAIVPGYLIIHPETKNRIRTLHGLVIEKRGSGDNGSSNSVWENLHLKVIDGVNLAQHLNLACLLVVHICSVVHIQLENDASI